MKTVTDTRSPVAQQVACDYDNQRWTNGGEANAIRREQLTKELALLRSSKGADYLRFTGSPYTLQQAIDMAEAAIKEVA